MSSANPTPPPARPCARPSARRSRFGGVANQALALGLAAAMLGGGYAKAQTPGEADEAPSQSPPFSLPATEDGGGVGVGPGTGAGVISYEPSFFDQYNPTNASDMVDRVPGFTVNDGEDVRGFGGSTGNVLIDGQRPASKSVDVGQYLQRIPVDQVVRIDLIRGGAPGVDMQGQPVVVNVIRKSGATAGGAVQLMYKPYPYDRYTGYIPRLELFWRNDRLSVDWQMNGRQDQDFDTGDGSLVRWFSDGTSKTGPFTSRTEKHTLQSNGTIEYLGLGGVLRLNAGVDRQDLDRREFVTWPFDEQSQVKQRSDKAEFGGDYQRDINDWLSANVIALRTWTGARQASFSRASGSSRQAIEDSLGGESIFRGTVAALHSPQMRFEFGGEGAFNYLDANSSLTQNGASVDLPAANIRVEEKRAEGFGTVTWNPSSRLGFEAGVRYETSTITSEQVGAHQEKTLNFVKPRLIVSFAPDSSSQIRLRLERTVGQLDFEDFAASTSLEAGLVTAGNPDIVPERAWLSEVALERRFWGRGAIVLTLSHAEVSDVVDLIPVDGRYDAPGNIGDGTRDQADLNLTLPLDRLGIPGGLIRATSTWRWSRVTDPVTGQRRRISDERNWEGDIQISKSIPSWKSVITLEGGQFFEEVGYRINEVRSTQDTPLWKIYWDWSPRKDLIFRFQYENFNGKERVRQRTVFDGTRAGGVVDFSERRYAELKPYFMFRVRKTF